MKPKPKLIERPGDQRFYDDFFSVNPGEKKPPVPDAKFPVGPTAEFLRKLRAKPKAP